MSRVKTARLQVLLIATAPDTSWPPIIFHLVAGSLLIFKAVFFCVFFLMRLQRQASPGLKFSVLSTLEPVPRIQLLSAPAIPWQPAFPSFHYWDKKFGRQLAAFGPRRLLSEGEDRMRKPRGRLA